MIDIPLQRLVILVIFPLLLAAFPALWAAAAVTAEILGQEQYYTINVLLVKSFLLPGGVPIWSVNDTLVLSSGGDEESVVEQEADPSPSPLQ